MKPEQVAAIEERVTQVEQAVAKPPASGGHKRSHTNKRSHAQHQADCSCRTRKDERADSWKSSWKWQGETHWDRGSHSRKSHNRFGWH